MQSLKVVHKMREMHGWFSLACWCCAWRARACCARVGVLLLVLLLSARCNRPDTTRHCCFRVLIVGLRVFCAPETCRHEAETRGARALALLRDEVQRQQQQQRPGTIDGFSCEVGVLTDSCELGARQRDGPRTACVSHTQPFAPASAQNRGAVAYTPPVSQYSVELGGSCFAGPHRE